VSNGVELARRAEEYVRASDVLQIANPASLGVVCFRINPKEMEIDDATLERVNETVQARIIEEAVAMMSSTRLRGLYSLRLCILNHATTWDDVRSTLAAVERFGIEMLESEGS